MQVLKEAEPKIEDRIEYQRKNNKISKRALMPCLVCKQLGYQYLKKKGQYEYMFTIHSNEQPIAIDRNGKPKWRTCYHKGRLYDSLQELIDSGELKTKISKPKLEQKNYNLNSIVCPECGEKGELKGMVRPYIRHKQGEKGRCIIKKQNVQMLVESQSIKIPTKSQEVMNKSPIRNGTRIICPDPKCRKEGKIRRHLDRAKKIYRYRVYHLDGTPRHYIPIGEIPQIVGRLESTQGGNLNG